MTTAPTRGAELVAMLERWEAHGGTWQVVHRAADRVTVAMCRCDGGEELDRVTSDAPEVLALVAGRDAPTPPVP